jgi:hypothetical protein
MGASGITICYDTIVNRHVAQQDSITGIETHHEQ